MAANRSGPVIGAARVSCGPDAGPDCTYGVASATPLVDIPAVLYPRTGICALAPLEIQLLLIVIAFLAGVGITAIGPGGIFLTMALYALLPIAPPTIAGTASATFIATGLVGSAAYLRSGELARRSNRVLAWILSAASIAGALAGSRLNPYLPKSIFGALLGGMAILTGVLIIVQQVRGLETLAALELDSAAGRVIIAVLGFGIGLSGALLGVGGPVLAVPALVVLGVPIVPAVAVAQLQSIFIAAFATVGYAVQGAVSWPLALLVGVPEVIGVVVGWRVAQRAAPGRLKVALGVTLVAVGTYLLL